MPLSDEELFDLDTSDLANWDEERSRAALSEFGDLFRNQLIVARFLQRWADRLEGGPDGERDFQRGYRRALREVAAHLRQADLVPGGVLYEESVGSRHRPQSS
jgi:hypothetical protein